MKPEILSRMKEIDADPLNGLAVDGFGRSIVAIFLEAAQPSELKKQYPELVTELNEFVTATTEVLRRYREEYIPTVASRAWGARDKDQQAEDDERQLNKRTEQLSMLLYIMKFVQKDDYYFADMLYDRYKVGNYDPPAGIALMR